MGAAEVPAPLERLVADRMEEGRVYEALRVGHDYFPVWRDPKTQRPYLRGEEDLFGKRSTMAAHPGEVRQVVAINGVITEVKKTKLRTLPRDEAPSPSLEERLASAPRVLGKSGPRVILDEQATRRVVEDFEGYDERPDPLQASSVEEFLEALREYRAWAGDPSYRRMSSNCGQKVAYSTFCTALNGDRLPKLPVVQACIEACGGGREDVQRWTTAWRRLRKQESAAPADSSAGARAAAQVFEFINHVSRAHTGA